MPLCITTLVIFLGAKRKFLPIVLGISRKDRSKIYGLGNHMQHSGGLFVTIGTLPVLIVDRLTVAR